MSVEARERSEAKANEMIKEMKKVFVVSVGDEDEYQIMAIFSSKKLANEYLEKQRARWNHRIDDWFQMEPWDVDE